MSRAPVQALAVAVVVAAVIGLTAGHARSQPTEAEKRADALFEEGRALVEANRFADACPKFEESQRLDPGLGTLLNLAACYEQVGRLASALTAFRAAEEQARAAGPSEKKRESTAAERARAIESRVARLTITLASGDRPAGFAVTRDGVPVPAVDFGRRIAVDPGTIVIAAAAPGHEPYSTDVVIAKDATTRTVDIPLLAPVGSKVGGGGDLGGGDLGGGDLGGGDLGGGDLGGGTDVIQPHKSPRKTIGVVVGAVGLAGLGGGVALGLSAKGQYDDVPCTQNASPPVGCTPDEESRIDRARSRGTLGTIVGGVGVAAVAAGLVLYLTAPEERTVAVAPVVGDGEVGVTFNGRF